MTLLQIHLASKVTYKQVANAIAEESARPPRTPESIPFLLERGTFDWRYVAALAKAYGKTEQEIKNAVQETRRQKETAGN